MTRREQLVEQYEDALFELLMDDVAESEGEKFEKLNDSLNSDLSAEVPEELNTRCLHTIKKEFAKENKTAIRHTVAKAFRVASAVALIAMLLFTTAFAAFPPVRVQTLNMIIETFGDHATIQFGSPSMNDSAKSDSNMGSTQLLSWIPENLSVADEWENDFARYVNLRGNNGEEVSVTTMKISETLVSDFDTENMERRSVFIHGKEVFLYEEKTEEYSTFSVAWTDEDKGQLIRVWGRGITVDEFISIANGVYAGNE